MCAGTMIQLYQYVPAVLVCIDDTVPTTVVLYQLNQLILKVFSFVEVASFDMYIHYRYDKKSQGARHWYLKFCWMRPVILSVLY